MEYVQQRMHENIHLWWENNGNDTMRLASIDVFRALTMVLMIWVNDFWSLSEVPKWLQHASATEDYLGFSDVIFPLFLFIVGLSLPLAIENRRKKGNSTGEIAKHLFDRTLSLLFIGFFMVNSETLHESTIIGTTTWKLLMALGIALIWMDWNRSPVPVLWHKPLKVTGWLIFALLAYSYRGGPEGNQWMEPQWWGILGLIGWAYGLNGFVYLYVKGNLVVMVVFWILLNGLSMASHSRFAISDPGFFQHFSTLYMGTIPAFTTAGMVATLLLNKMKSSKPKFIYPTLMGLGLIHMILGILTRPIWGISKIQATFPWLAICTGIGFLTFGFLLFLVDDKNKKNWAKWIRPAGTATLTCYMLPYFIYPFYTIFGWKLPTVLNAGLLGLFLSMCFALLVVTLTGYFEKKGLKLKL